MFGFLKNHICPIGIDICDDRIKLAQLEKNTNGVSLLASSSQERPSEILLGSSQWQKWLIDTVKSLAGQGTFKGKDVIASVPAADIFIDHLKTPKVPKNKFDETILSRIKQRLPYEPEQAILQYINGDEDNILVMVMQREKIDRHLAVYEQANLHIQSLGVWPVAMAKTYTRFFGRRKTDQTSIVLIIDVEPNNSSVIICRHCTVLFARSIPIGNSSFTDEETVKKLVLELGGCLRHFGSLYRKPKIERMIFLSSDNITPIIQNTYASIARQMELPAQMGNCMAAVNLSSQCSEVERRGCNFSWATAFGLSLSSVN
ncbi:MAG: pilus assembly protein PilM [Phycisphaerae bacterium]